MSPEPPAPDPTTAALRRVRRGMWPAGWIAIGYVLSAGLVLLTRNQPGLEASLQEPAYLWAFVAFDLVLAALAVGLWFKMRGPPARWAALVLLVWILFETGAKALDQRWLGFGVDLLMSLTAVGAAQGAFAWRRAQVLRPATTVL